MFDNLVGADLSGITGHIEYNSMDAAMPGVLMGLAVIILFMVFIFGLFDFMKGTKTNQHRKKLVDMYVSGMIRKFAKDDGVDLENEYKLFVKESKKEKLYLKDLDSVVEAELSEKIVDKQERELSKLNKK